METRILKPLIRSIGQERVDLNWPFLISFITRFVDMYQHVSAFGSNEERNKEIRKSEAMYLALLG